MKTHHAAKILLSERVIMDALQLNGGTIWYIGKDENYHRTVVLCVEHPDLPEMKEGEEYPIVYLSFKLEQEGEKVTRIEPVMGLRTRLRRLWNRITKGVRRQ